MTTEQLEFLVDCWVDLMADSAPELDVDGSMIVGREAHPKEGIVLLIKEYPYDAGATVRKVLVTAKEMK